MSAQRHLRLNRIGIPVLPDAKHTCRRKKCYTDPATAQEVADWASWKSGSPIHPYRCTVCGNLHIGHKLEEQ